MTTRIKPSMLSSTPDLQVDTLYANNIQGNASNLITIPTGHAIAGTDDASIYSPGTVIQTVQTVKTDTFTSTSSTPVDVTGLAVNIIPKFSNSQILINYHISFSGSGHSDLYLVRRLGGSDTFIARGDQRGSSRSRSTSHAYFTTSYNTTYTAYDHGMTFIDTPSTTSSVTYKIMYACPATGQTGCINYVYSESDALWATTTISTITVQEIAQ